MKIRLKNTLPTILMGLISMPAFAAGELTVEGPFARAVPPGVTNSAAFMVLNNAGDTERKLVSASSAVSETVELHTHTMDNGVMRMRQVPEILVPAKGQTELKPGGYHIMFLGLKQAVKPGDSVEVTLKFANGEEMPVRMTAQKMAPRKGHGNDKGHGHGHHHHHRHHH